MQPFRQTAATIALACALGTSLYAATVNAASAPASASTADNSVVVPQHRGNPAAASEHMAQMEKHRAAKAKEIHDLLKITPDQEEAWKTFTASMTPPRPDQAEAAMPKPKKGEAGLTTPEVLDMRLAMLQRQEAMLAQRATAVKTFYAQLTPDQQKLFDYISRREMHHMHGHYGSRGPGPEGGKPMLHRGDISPAGMPPK